MTNQWFSSRLVPAYYHLSFVGMRKDNDPSGSAYTPVNAAQDAVAFLHCEGRLLPMPRLLPSLYCCKGLFLPKVIPWFCPALISYGSDFAWLKDLNKKKKIIVQLLSSVTCLTISFIRRFSSGKNTRYVRLAVTADWKQRLYFIGYSTSGRDPAASRAALVESASTPLAKVESRTVQIFIAHRNNKQE